MNDFPLTSLHQEFSMDVWHSQHCHPLMRLWAEDCTSYPWFLISWKSFSCRAIPIPIPHHTLYTYLHILVYGTLQHMDLVMAGILSKLWHELATLSDGNGRRPRSSQPEPDMVCGRYLQVETNHMMEPDSSVPYLAHSPVSSYIFCLSKEPLAMISNFKRVIFYVKPILHPWRIITNL